MLTKTVLKFVDMEESDMRQKKAMTKEISSMWRKVMSLWDRI